MQTYFRLVESQKGPRSLRLTDEEKQQMVQMYQQGNSLREIGFNFHGISPKYVSTILRQQGVEMRPRGWPKGKPFVSDFNKGNKINDQIKDEVVRLYTEHGLNQEAVARETAVSPQSVLNILRERGIQVDRQGTDRTRGELGSYEVNQDIFPKSASTPTWKLVQEEID